METILKIRMARKQAEARQDGRCAVPQQQGTGSAIVMIRNMRMAAKNVGDSGSVKPQKAGTKVVELMAKSRDSLEKTGTEGVTVKTGTEGVTVKTGTESVAGKTGTKSVAGKSGTEESVAGKTETESAAVKTGTESVAGKTGTESVAVKTGTMSVAGKTGTESVAVKTGTESVNSCPRMDCFLNIAGVLHQSQVTAEDCSVSRENMSEQALSSRGKPPRGPGGGRASP